MAPYWHHILTCNHVPHLLIDRGPVFGTLWPHVLAADVESIVHTTFQPSPQHQQRWIWLRWVLLKLTVHGHGRVIAIYVKNDDSGNNHIHE